MNSREFDRSLGLSAEAAGSHRLRHTGRLLCRLTLVLGLASALLLAPKPAAAQRQSGIQVTPGDGDYILVSKDYGGQRWAISYDTFDGFITGTVSPLDGSTPSFVFCEVLDTADNGDLTLDCSGGPSCTTGPCGDAAWASLGTVPLPGSFFELPAGTASAAGKTVVRFKTRG